MHALTRESCWLAGWTAYWLKWGRGGRLSCKCTYVINFFHRLKVNRNKVKVSYSDSQIIYLLHTVKKHKPNPRGLLDVVLIQHFLITLCRVSLLCNVACGFLMIVIHKTYLIYHIFLKTWYPNVNTKRRGCKLRGV